MVNGTNVKGKYKYTEGIPVGTQLDWLTTVIFFKI